MIAPNRVSHSTLAEALRRAVLEGPGETDPTLRRAVAERAAGGPPTKRLYDDLARQIGEAACRVKDAQIEAVVKTSGSEKATFEIIAAAAMGAGLFRWQQALKAMEAATDAPA